MSREANMELQRSRREHEHRMKFGRAPEIESSEEDRKKHNEEVLKRLRSMKEHEHPYWGEKK